MLAIKKHSAATVTTRKASGASTHPRVASLLFERPLMIFQPKLDVIINSIAPRIGVNIFTPAMAYPGAINSLPDYVPAPLEDTGNGSIAVIDIHGSLVKRACGMQAESGLCTYEDLEEQIMDAATNSNIKGIFLNIDSEGGECNGVFDLANLIFQARQFKPIYACASDLALSAAYLLGSAAEKLFVSQSGMVGSIGVIAVHVDQSESDAVEGLKYTTIKYGLHKDDLSPHKKLNLDGLNWLQSSVDRLGDMFVAAVAQYRGISADIVKGTQAGIFSGSKMGNIQSASDIGLADGMASEDEVITMLSDRISGRLVSRTRSIAATVAVSAPALSADAILNKGEVFNMANPSSTTADSAVAPSTTTTATAAAPVAAAPAMAAVAAAPVISNRMSLEEIDDLNDLCSIAGKPNALSGFLRSGMSFKDAKKSLIDGRAAASEGEIQAQHSGTSGVTTEARPKALSNACAKISQKMYGGVKN